MRGITAAVVGAMLVLAVGAGPASADDEPLDQCVVHVVGQEETGELLLDEPTCYASLDEALETEGVAMPGEEDEASRGSLAQFVIGIHYDGAGYTGASTSVLGSDCAGGYINLNATWNNRISSTKSGCPTIRHYNGFDKTGSSETTVSPGGNLTALNNAASSIQYLS